ncbi:cytochrome c [Piscinibacter gummiphilus]|uniref:Cytochrome c n=1 Tax=Piscinibacter gummiphilus TaxID=946333 RepID=A0ABZ0D6P6_9BURK|nr:cytochrome c [Piscinibacter gummiphilus]WOB11040.1 cytochrome c [Piscinibacter gummiphilus]
MAAAALAAASLGAQADDREAGRKLFTSGAAPSCATCHTLRDAGATGEIGPVLDELKPDEARVVQALRNGLGVMPSFRDKLSDNEIALLARYVSQVAGR